MLEKIGLPPKPALRGNSWVVDASHCQCCSSQFTFINRKHHCRRCGGLFCNGCTQQRMVLRGLGDSAVRICEPCKKLEEAARFEMRQGRRAGRASVKSTPRHEDEVLNQILGHDSEQPFSSGKQSTNDKVPCSQRSVGSASSSNVNYNDGDLQKIISNDNMLGTEVGSSAFSPEELRKQALEEKKKYKILKADGKSEEALRAFKRGKELERQADALEAHLRKARKKVLTAGNLSNVQNVGIPVESARTTKSLPHMGKEKDDIASELRELGWSDNDDRKSANLSLEGELSSIIGEVSSKMGEEKGRRIDNTQVVVLKKRALMLKREGKLAEAKEELKRAKILEKQLEEQELIGEAEDSDDELSALIRGMDDGKEEFSDLHDYNHGLELDDSVLGISDDLDSNFEVTDEDMMDPELAETLKSLGWSEPENTFFQSQPFEREALLSEIQSLKREALNQKRAGNTEEAMAFLKKAKLLEGDLNNSGSEVNNTMMLKTTAIRKNVSSKIAGNGSDSFQLDETNTNVTNNASSMFAPKSRLTIQRELLTLKKKALTLRREGKLNEAEDVLHKCAALENQLMEMDKASNLKAPQLKTRDNVPHTTNKHPYPNIHRDFPLSEGDEDDITDQDMSDPAYLSVLRDLGWNDENNEISNASKPSNKDVNHSVPINDASSSQHSTNNLAGAPRSRVEIQRELLALKRKALALRREGKAEDAEEVLNMAKELETKIAEMEDPKKERVDTTLMKDKIFIPPAETAGEEGRDGVVSEEDMHDPTLNSMLISLGWKDEEPEPVTIKNEPLNEASNRFTDIVDLSAHESSSGIPAAASRSKGEIQRELLVLKRKALTLRRKGEMEKAEETLRMAESLEAQIEDFGAQNKGLLLNERHGGQEDAMEFDKGSASSVVGSRRKNAAEPFIGLEKINNNPLSRKTNNLLLGNSHLLDGKNHLSVGVSAASENPAKKIKAEENIGNQTSSGHCMNTPDLLSGDGFSGSELSTQKQKEEYQFGSGNSSQAGPPLCLDSSVTFSQDQGCKDNFATQNRRESTDLDEKPSISEPNAVQDNASFHQEILAYKRKAVALKREGKLAEAREELRQAKVLEKNLEDGTMQPSTASTSTSSCASHVQKKQDSSKVTGKPMLSRDRFKLQQESLAHKRQALKLRREGRMEEAEAEFERAKALETQLEELAGHDSGKSSDSKLDAVDDVTVEDFLDPQLLGALKAVGLEDVGVVSKVPERQEPVKPSVAKIEDSNQERIQLEEIIKAEKIKAVNLKRSGKQAEALDALRRAKLYEKKLNSIISG